VPIQRGGSSTYLAGLIDRVLGPIAHISGFEFFFGFGEVVVGFFDVVAGPVKSVSELVDGAGITALELVVELPRIASGKSAKVSGVEIDQADRGHGRA
jgi:hypothetical protein